MHINQVKSILREIAQLGCVKLTKHYRARMKERQVTTDDFLHVLLWGDIVNIEEDQENKNLKCEVQGKDLDGEDLTLHIALLENESSVLCITLHG
jgi:hypothetical protein